MIRIILLVIAISISNNVHSQTLLKENFDEGLSNEWVIVDDKPSYSGPSNWFIENEVLRQTSNIWAYEAPDEFKYHLGTHIVRGNSDWDNYSINALIKATDNDGIGILFRYQDDKNYYRFLLIEDANNGGPKRKIQKFIDGEVYTLYEQVIDDAIPKGWFAVTAKVNVDSISIYFDGYHFKTIIDSTYKKGKVGLTCYAMSGAYFDSVSVTRHDVIYDKPANLEIFSQRQPYIQLSSTNSVSVAWNTKEKVVGKVVYGRNEQIINTISEDSLTNKHLLTINDLETNSIYNYSVYNNENLLIDSNSFKTVRSEEDDTLKFLIWGDSGTGNEAQYKVAKLINAESDNVDFGLHVGDVSQSDGEEYDNIFFKPYEEFVANNNVYTCIGNHDTYFDNAATYLNDFYYSLDPKISERYFSFKRGKGFFISIDSNIDYTKGSDQYNFIKSELESDDCQSSKWRFVFFHHPPYCELWDSWGGEEKVRQHLIPLFENNGVDIVFNGHTHGYERGLLNGIFYVITGGGGGDLDYYARDWDHISKSLSTHHYTKVEIQENTLKLRAINVEGSVIDSFQIYKPLVTVDDNPRVIENTTTLFQNYPNPFNNTTNISFYLSYPSSVRIRIYNGIGEEVEELYLGKLGKGKYSVPYSNSKLTSGHYFVKMEANKSEFTQKMILMK